MEMVKSRNQTLNTYNEKVLEKTKEKIVHHYYKECLILQLKMQKIIIELVCGLNIKSIKRCKSSYYIKRKFY